MKIRWAKALAGAREWRRKLLRRVLIRSRVRSDQGHVCKLAGWREPQGEAVWAVQEQLQEQLSFDPGRSWEQVVGPVTDFDFDLVGTPGSLILSWSLFYQLQLKETRTRIRSRIPECQPNLQYFQVLQYTLVFFYCR